MNESEISTAAGLRASPWESDGGRRPSEAQIIAAAHAVRDSHPFKICVSESNLSGTIETVRVVARNVPRGGRILDFGAGGANKTCALAELGYEMHAYDDLMDPWHLRNDNWRRLMEYAESRGVRYHRAVEGEPWPYAAESFDMIVLDNVIEHLHDSPRGLLVGIRELLRPGGLLFISVPNAGNLRKRFSLLLGGTNMARYDYFYWKPGPWRGHVREYVRGDIERLARYLGLTPVELGGFDSLIGRLSGARRWVWRLIVKVIPNGSDSWKLVGRKEPGSEAMKEPPDEGGLREMLAYFEV